MQNKVRAWALDIWLITRQLTLLFHYRYQSKSGNLKKKIEFNKCSAKIEAMPLIKSKNILAFLC